MTEIVIGPGIDPDIKFDGLVPGLKYDDPFDFKVEIGRWDDVKLALPIKIIPKGEFPRDSLPQFDDKSAFLDRLSAEITEILDKNNLEYDFKLLAADSLALKFIKITVPLDEVTDEQLLDMIGDLIEPSGPITEVDARFQGGGKFYEIKLFDVAVPPAEQEAIITGMDDLIA